MSRTIDLLYGAYHSDLSEWQDNDGYDVQAIKKNGDTDPNVDDLLHKVVKISLMYLTDANGMLRIDSPLTLPVYNAILYLVKVGKSEIINCGDNRIFVKWI